MRNNLNGHIYGFCGSFVSHVMYVAAAQIREALTRSERLRRAVFVVHRERSLCHCDQTRARMGVPPSLTPGLEGDLDDIDVRISLHLCLEVPPVKVHLIAHQFEQARWEETGLRRVSAE